MLLVSCHPDGAGREQGLRVALVGVPHHQIDDSLPEVHHLFLVNKLGSLVAQFFLYEEEEHL